MSIVYSNKAMADVDGSINKAIASFGKAKNLIQVAAVAILYHIAKCGDYRKANTLVDGLVGLNQKALIEFFVQFGGLTVSEGAKGFDGWKGFDAVNIQAGKKTMWFDLKVQKAWEGFNLRAKILTVISSAEEANKKVVKSPELAEIVDVDPALLDHLKALVA
jgi:hypothetical protein